MSDTTVEVDVMSAVWPVRGNQTVAELVQREYERVGQPQWSDEEEKLARELQAKAGVKVEGLRRDVHRMKGPAVQKPAANDAGDVSWKVPMAKMYFPANIPNINFHHWAAGVALGTSIAHKGAEVGAKALANSIIECFVNPAIVAEARRTHEKEIEGTNTAPCCRRIKSLRSLSTRPTMAKYRDAMREHYVKETPSSRERRRARNGHSARSPRNRVARFTIAPPACANRQAASLALDAVRNRLNNRPQRHATGMSAAQNDTKMSET